MALPASTAVTSEWFASNGELMVIQEIIKAIEDLADRVEDLENA